MKKICMYGIHLLLAASQLHGENIDEGEWRSTEVLSTLLAGNPVLRVNSESSELTLSNGRIFLSATANIESTASGPVTMTGDAVVKAKGRYRLIQRGSRTFIRITSVRAD